MAYAVCTPPPFEGDNDYRHSRRKREPYEAIRASSKAGCSFCGFVLRNVVKPAEDSHEPGSESRQVDFHWDTSNLDVSAYHGKKFWDYSFDLYVPKGMSLLIIHS